MELRLVLTVDDLDAALAVYRDGLGLPEREMWLGEDEARGVLLDAGSASLELVNEAHAAAIDDAEVGRRVSGPVRIAFGVDDSEATAAALVAAGASQVAEAVTTPWRDRNVRVQAADGMQLTLFSVLD